MGNNVEKALRFGKTSAVTKMPIIMLYLIKRKRRLVMSRRLKCFHNGIILIVNSFRFVAKLDFCHHNSKF